MTKQYTFYSEFQTHTTRIPTYETPIVVLFPSRENTRNDMHSISLVLCLHTLFCCLLLLFLVIHRTMDALLASETQNQKKSDLRESLCYYLSIIFVLLALIASSVSLGLCSAVFICVFPLFIEYYSGEDLYL